MKIHATHPPLVLAILDGFGLASETTPGNAITRNTAPHIFSYMDRYPIARLTAHGEAVGLFHGQTGNSEAGHLNIGAGRVVEQDLVRISIGMKDGTFFKNTAFREALQYAQEHDSAIHLMGLLTDNESAHARPEHIEALIAFFRRAAMRRIFLHLFTDGRDAPQHAALTYLAQLRACCRSDVTVASITGRLYAMDRNKLWDRTRAAYETIIDGRGAYTAPSAEAAIEQAYSRGETDEYISPTVIVNRHGVPLGKVHDHDVVIFFNARSDRARQLTKAFVQDDFMRDNPGAFRRARRPKHIRFVAMTDFGPDLPGTVTAFPSPDIDMCLAAAVGDHRTQLYVAESEKFAHVTYFLNGGFPKAINGEVREQIPSHTATSHARFPGMRARELTTRILTHLQRRRYDFVVVNYANADMIGHTGNLSAAERGVRILDREIHRLVTGVQKHGGTVLVTADHGTAEVMRDTGTDAVRGAHTTSPVPFIIIGSEPVRIRPRGKLADIAPTVLALIGKKKPKAMTGRSLIVHR